MLKQQARLIAALVFAVDLALVTAAFLGAHGLRSRGLGVFGGGDAPALYPLDRYLPLLPLALAIWGLLLWSSGRYRSHRRVPLGDGRRHRGLRARGVGVPARRAAAR
jgi:hypothetical protein